MRALARLVPDAAILAMMGGQVTIWAALFYAFPALVLPWEAEFGWSSAQIMGAYSLAIALYALGAPLCGRLIDRGLAPFSLPGGGVLAALLLLAVTQVETLALFYLLWALAGVAMGLTLYEAAFAIITRARADRARQAITGVALVAGFASSLSYPMVTLLAEAGGWRFALAVMAGLVLVVNVPLARLAARRLEAEAVPATTESQAPRRPRHLLQNPTYWLIAGGFALASFATGTVLSHLFPLMEAQNVPSGVALFAVTLIGPAQVAGRVAMMTAGRQVAAIRIAMIGMAMLSLGAGALTGAAFVALLVLVFAIAQGAGYGIVGILRAEVTRVTFGQRDYGAIAGAVSLPSLLAFALAPVSAALVADSLGYGPVLAFCVAAPLLGALCLGAAART